MSESKKAKHVHILSPVSARAHIKRDRSERPLRSISKPRLIVDLLLDQVPLSITDVSIPDCLDNISANLLNILYIYLFSVAVRTDRKMH